MRVVEKMIITFLTPPGENEAAAPFQAPYTECTSRDHRFRGSTIYL